MEQQNNKPVPRSTDEGSPGQYYYKVPTVAVAPPPKDEPGAEPKIILVAAVTAVVTALVCLTVCGCLMLFTGAITIGGAQKDGALLAVTKDGVTAASDGLSSLPSSTESLSTLSQSNSISSLSDASEEIKSAAQAVQTSGSTTGQSASSQASDTTYESIDAKDEITSGAYWTEDGEPDYGASLPYTGESLLDIGLPVYGEDDGIASDSDASGSASAQDSLNTAMSVSSVVKSVMPWVVSIINETSNYFGVSTSGSGFIISDDGYILTNEHIVSDAKSITVLLKDGTNYTGTLVGSDEATDIAVVKIDAKGLPRAAFADSDALEVGDVAIAIGNPYGIDVQSTVTCGIVSGLNRSLSVDDSRVSKLIKTDASINYGNSGGPLVDIQGRAIGICSQTISDGNDGLGYAIPIDSARDIAEELIRYGKIRSRASMGIQAVMLTSEFAATNGLPVGLRVTGFTCEEPIDAGLRRGDIITKINGKDITSLAVYNEEKAKYQSGDGIIVTVYRPAATGSGEKSEELDIDIVLVEQE